MTLVKDYLQDTVRMTQGVGYEIAKISGDENETTIEAIDADKSVVLYGKFNAPVEEFKGTIGLGRINVLSGYLKFDPFMEDSASISVDKQERNGEDVPVSISFKSGNGHNASYRFMSKEIVEEQLKTPKFKGVTWDVEVNPTVDSVKDLIYFNGILGAFEPTFTPKVENGTLNFYIGGGASDSSVVPFAYGVSGDLKNGWSWPIAQVLSILRLPGEHKMSFSDKGALQIEVDTGLGVYQYILPAKSK